jgi:hypothetical protein
MGLERLPRPGPVGHHGHHLSRSRRSDTRTVTFMERAAAAQPRRTAHACCTITARANFPIRTCRAGIADRQHADRRHRAEQRQRDCRHFLLSGTECPATGDSDTRSPATPGTKRFPWARRCSGVSSASHRVAARVALPGRLDPHRPTGRCTHQPEPVSGKQLRLAKPKAPPEPPPGVSPARKRRRAACRQRGRPGPDRLRPQRCSIPACDSPVLLPRSGVFDDRTSLCAARRNGCPWRL